MTTHKVQIADMAVVRGTHGEIITHALGSCIGVIVFDPVSRVAGLLHFMLPNPQRSQEAGASALMYCSSGLPALFHKAYEAGAEKERLVVAAAGGAAMISGGGDGRVGDRNRTMLRKMLWKNNITLSAEDTGGGEARTLRIDLESGRMYVNKGSNTQLLWSPASALSHPA